MIKCSALRLMLLCLLALLHSTSASTTSHFRDFCLRHFRKRISSVIIIFANALWQFFLADYYNHI